MLPLKDNVPTRAFPAVTVALITANVIVWLWEWQTGVEKEVLHYGYYPCSVEGPCVVPASSVDHLPWFAGVFTSMFMHASWIHIGGNMLFLWIFGDNVEDSMDHVRYLVFYLACGIAAAMTQALMNPDSTIPMVGASGAISGVLGAYVLLHPHATVRVLIFIGVFATIAHMPALIVLGLWFLTQFVSAAFSQTGGPGVAFWAHVGGFVAGMVFVPLLKQKGVSLFQPAHSRPFEIERRRSPWG
jgi:membrane associated rhomboid family serine protease